MDCNRKEGNWSELKGQAKQQLKRFQVGSLLFTSSQKSGFEGNALCARTSIINELNDFGEVVTSTLYSEKTNSNE